jgi:hypothetical protein
MTRKQYNPAAASADPTATGSGLVTIVPAERGRSGGSAAAASVPMEAVQLQVERPAASLPLSQGQQRVDARLPDRWLATEPTAQHPHVPTRQAAAGPAPQPYGAACTSAFAAAQAPAPQQPWQVQYGYSRATGYEDAPQPFARASGMTVFIIPPPSPADLPVTQSLQHGLRPEGERFAPTRQAQRMPASEAAEADGAGQWPPHPAAPAAQSYQTRAQAPSVSSPAASLGAWSYFQAQQGPSEAAAGPLPQAVLHHAFSRSSAASTSSAVPLLQLVEAAGGRSSGGGGGSRSSGGGGGNSGGGGVTIPRPLAFQPPLPQQRAYATPQQQQHRQRDAGGPMERYHVVNSGGSLCGPPDYYWPQPQPQPGTALALGVGVIAGSDFREAAPQGGGIAPPGMVCARIDQERKM